MKKAVTAAALIALLGLSGCSRVSAYFTDGAKELQTALQAKAAAKSFTMTTKIAAHDENVLETHFYVSCPDRERITQKIGKSNREMVRIGQRFFLNEDGAWYFKDVDLKDWSPCGPNPGLPSPWALMTEGRDLLAVFNLAKDKFKVGVAEPTDYNGKKYKTYTVRMTHNGEESPFKYTVLLDEQHRPAVISFGRSSLTEYSDWDKPITIEAPANALPYPETPEQPAPAQSAPLMKHGHGM